MLAFEPSFEIEAERRRHQPGNQYQSVEDDPFITKKNAVVHEGLSGLIIRVFGQGATSLGKMTGQCRASRRAQPADGAAAEGDITDRRPTHGRESQAQSSKCKQTYPEPADRQQPNREATAAYATHRNSAEGKYDSVSLGANCNPSFGGQRFTILYTIEPNMEQWQTQECQGAAIFVGLRL